MNGNSKICNYINENPNTWRKDFDDMSIRFKENEYSLCIFKYNLDADFSNPIALEARGIIIDLKTLEPVCVPFDKFFNSHEEHAATIDWSSAKVLEKLDGSICKLYWNPYEDNWRWATNGVIDARDAECNDLIHNTYQDLIESADNFKDIDYSKLDKNITYIFEVVDPIMHPVKYDNVHLYHIGARDKTTLKELDLDIGIEKPREYLLKNFDETYDYVQKMNEGLENIEHEGFVIVDENWNRIKLKDPKYLEIHYLANGVITNKSKILEMLHSDDINVEKIIKDYPAYKDVFEHYINQEILIENEVDKFIKFSRDIFEKTGSRKIVAENILGNKYQDLGFKALGNEKTAKQLISELDKHKYEKLIDEYKNPEIEKEPGEDGLF